MFCSSLCAALGALTLVLPVVSSPAPVPLAPAISLHFARQLNISGSTLAEIDRARAAHLIATGRARHGAGQYPKLSRRGAVSSISATNNGVTYVTSVGVGTPPTEYSLLIDTGSSNTWVGAGQAYVETSSSHATGKNVSVSYGSGSFSGLEYLDTVTLSPSLVIEGQSIGVASTSSGFGGYDGILGLGPVDLTTGTVAGTSTVPTVPDNLASQQVIPSEVVGISYNPTTSTGNTNGELTFGGVDPSQYTGDITYVPLTSTSPASDYWGLSLSISYGSERTTVLGSNAGILDTGTTLVLLAADAFNTYTSLTGATEDSATGLLAISSANYANLQSLYFDVGGAEFELTANAQTWPRALNTFIGGQSANVYLVVNNIGSSNGGLEFINGYTFLERFYSVFDTTNHQVGLATTQNTYAVSN